jgi:hypothetical protein
MKDNDIVEIFYQDVVKRVSQVTCEEAKRDAQPQTSTNASVFPLPRVYLLLLLLLP